MEMGKTKDAKRKQKPMKVHNLKAQVTGGTWLQQPYMAQHNPPTQREL